MIKNITEEDSIINNRNNFQGLFVAVGALISSINDDINKADTRTVKALGSVINDRLHENQSKAFFLYREAAKGIAYIIENSSDKKLKKNALSLLGTAIKASSGKRLLAVSEAAGTLRLKIAVRTLPAAVIRSIPAASFNRVLQKAGVNDWSNPCWKGRSLVVDIDEKRLLVFKMAKEDDSIAELNQECLHSDYLREKFYTDLRFDLPIPIKFSEHYLFSLKDTPIAYPDYFTRHRKNICIAFKTDRTYFIYPNDKSGSFSPDQNSFKEMMERNSRLFGELTGAGLIHTAPVPLFHNRVQQGRRKDNGLYLWEKAGRLDRWIESCRYPNFGKSGIRDLEHILLYNGDSVHLYKKIGSHLLALFLVAGSFFRNIGKDGADRNLTGKRGFELNGKPLDLRSLFDKKVLKNCMDTIIKNYYKGFTGKEMPPEALPDTAPVTEAMIREMGVDRYMEEVFRVADQNEMSDKEFIDFLLERGFSPESAAKKIRGRDDIVAYTGPHLGGFNQKFSIPELTDLIAALSAETVKGRFESDWDRQNS